MKICAVSQSFYPHTGGVSYYLLWLGRRCKKLGHKLCVIHLRPPNAPVEDVIGNIKVYRTPKEQPDPQDISGYTRFKELILKVLYGFNEYLTINSFFKDRILEVYEKERFDLLHIHDFQIMPLGSMLKDLAVPKVFTWHIPFTERAPKKWREFATQYMQYYDRVVLSTKPYVAIAIHSGLSWEKAVCINPFIIVEKPKTNRFRRKYKISRDEKIILCVARIDPLKGQDRLVNALPIILQKINKVKCVFIGDGSMTKDVL
ncbi:MAG: glycosyltransferase family 4 protein, partial [Candidatus Bathyarchaeia archaeon]